VPLTPSLARRGLAFHFLERGASHGVRVRSSCFVVSRWAFVRDLMSEHVRPDAGSRAKHTGTLRRPLPLAEVAADRAGSGGGFGGPPALALGRRAGAAPGAGWRSMRRAEGLAWRKRL